MRIRLRPLSAPTPTTAEAGTEQFPAVNVTMNNPGETFNTASGGDA